MSSAAPSPIPNAPAYASAEVMANNAYNAALAQLNRNRLNTLTQYGYTGTVDPTTGVLSGVTVDPHAVHGQLQDLLHNQAVEDMHAAQAGMDRGLIGGLAHQAGSELRFQHSGQTTQLGQALTQQLSDYQDQQQQAAEARDNALWQAEQNAASQAASDQEGQTIDQLVQALGDPQAAQSDANPTSGVESNVPGDSKPVKPAKAARTKALRRVLTNPRRRVHARR